tara:strand:+ start:324 stop:593 length:270 start_codon:yes stop_codon:yes gene_type:complete
MANTTTLSQFQLSVASELIRVCGIQFTTVASLIDYVNQHTQYPSDWNSDQDALDEFYDVVERRVAAGYNINGLPLHWNLDWDATDITPV